MKRIILFQFILSAISIGTFAQQMINGRVTDASGNNPLAGATVSLAGKNVAVTDNDGQFSIGCVRGATLRVTFVGYETYSHVIKNCEDELKIDLISLSHTLDDVEITATSNQNKSILYQPSSITKLATPELKRGLGLFMDDAINGNVPGVIMQRRAVSSGQQFNIRGYGNGVNGTRGVSSNFDGQGYKVYLNGIPITDAEGITMMDDIDFGSVGDVEVTKGPAGTLYGLAVAGVVNLQTIKPEKGNTSISQDVLFGSYGLQRYTTRFQMGGDRSSLLVNYGHQKMDGYTIHNNSKKDFVNISGDFNPNDKESLSVYFGYSKSYDERNGELTIAQYNANDFSGNINYIKQNGHSEITSFRAGITHTYNFTKNISNTTTLFGTGASSDASSAAGWTDKDPINYGLRSVMNTNFVLQKGYNLSGITGIEAQRQIAQTIGYRMSDPQGNSHVWNIGDPYYIITSQTSNKYTISSTKSLFTEWTLAMPLDFSVTAGVGYSTMMIDLQDRNSFSTTIPSRFDTSYKKMLSPHFAINKVFRKNYSVYFSYSKGYKAPTSSYFYIPYVTGVASGTGIIDQNLKPEIGNQFEIGTKGKLWNNRLNYQVAFFDAIFSNKMGAINVLDNSGTTTLYSYIVNAGKQEDKGIEALVKITAYQSASGFIESVKPFANFTYSNFKYKDYSFHYKGKVQIDSVVNYDGKAVAGVPKFTGNLGVDVAAHCGLYGNMMYNYKDGFPITSDGLLNTSSYSLLNAKLGYKKALSNHFDLDLSFGITNITGTKYPIMVFTNQIPDAYLTGPTKANYFGTLNLKYNF
ncbi:MAG: TonB-dependent receptor [Bacteroidetes bacterium]|nr:TonB-dependent receptor [Bacteroidota bacterium]MBS1932222.1 TonB-dependent receptor [Bacteroidota bacterium]